MSNDVFIQVGVTALRGPTGEFLPAVPLYIRADKLKQSGLTQAEENLLRDVSGVFVDNQEKIRNLNKNIGGQYVSLQKNNDR